MKAEERHEIMEVKKYLAPDGREVREFTQAFGKNKEPSFCHGIAVVRVRMRAANGQEHYQERPVEFPFPEGVGVKAAFDTFDEVARIHIDKLAEQEKAKEQSRIDANRVIAAPPGVASKVRRLVGADGKPM